MGMLTKLFGRGPDATPPVELSAQLLADAEACLSSGQDAGGCTVGIGKTTRVTVAGTPLRQDALRFLLSRRNGAGTGVPAVIMREPTNPHDPNAVRVLIDGVFVGYFFRDQAAAWKPVLLEVEQRGQILVGEADIFDRHSEDAPLGAAVKLRDNLPGYNGPVTKARTAKAKAAKDAKAVRATPGRRLEGDDLTAVVHQLKQLSEQDPVSTKQAVGLVVKKFRLLLPDLYAHANALQAAGTEDFLELLEQIESEAEDLLTEPEDANDREDMHMDFQSSLDVLHGALKA